jgi:hypothetical protein
MTEGDEDQHRLKPQGLSRSKNELTLYSLTIFFLIAALLVDSFLSDVSSIVNRVLPEPMRIVLFSTIVGIAVVTGSYVIRNDTNKVKHELGSRKNVLPLISRPVAAVQYTIVGLLVLIAIQVIFTSEYFLVFLIAALVLSWLVVVGLMGLMSFKFFQWYRSRKSTLVLLYLIFSLMISTIQLTISIPTFFIIAQSAPFSVNAHSTEVKPFQANTLDLGTLFAVVSGANWFVIPMSYVVWLATAVMLYHYSSSFGRVKYWLMLSASLAGLVIGDVALLVFVPSVNTVFDQKVIFYTMILFGGLLAGGLLLAFAFRVVSRNLRNKTDKKLSDYLAIASRGIAILFVASYANVSAGSYLPFGIVASSFLHLGAFLFFAGVYTSAISIASDFRLRQTIRKSLLDQSKLLDNIALADINIELEKQTVDILNKHKETMKKETGIESSISEFDMKNYVKEVMAEVQKTRERKSSSGK